jgi:6-phosphogluconolactonase
MITERRIFQSAEALAKRLAQDVAAMLREEIHNKSSAVLAVSGGTTPQTFFAALSKQKLDWSNVWITLVDERQVEETSDRSNAKLVKQHLCVNEASAAHFVPLYLNPDAENLAAFDVAILGMGNDGHTASFFPAGDNLRHAIDPETSQSIVKISAPGSGEPRLTFTLPRLLAAKNLVLHIQGQDKMATLNMALDGKDQFEMPVRAVLNSNKSVQLYWCP